MSNWEDGFRMDIKKYTMVEKGFHHEGYWSRIKEIVKRGPVALARPLNFPLPVNLPQRHEDIRMDMRSMGLFFGEAFDLR